MSKTVESRKEIPNAPFYVLSNDKFMSGWGAAEGKTNTIILPCDSWQEAEIVADNAKGRSDQKNVRIVINKPRLQSHVVYSLLTKEGAARWYERGSWPGPREG
uniref:Uncharacterized protein n=1 Tax=viral metagenome TaxID=1070528 RepID=A0A6M3K9G2_9ZZZZ